MYNPNRRRLDLTKPKDRKTALLICFGTIAFTLVGLVVGYFTVLKPILQIRRSKNFVETPCTIKSMQRKRVHKGSVVVVRYTYEFDGQTYTSDRYGFSGPADDHKAFRRQAPGTRSICFVNPDNPAEAVMSREYIKTFFINILVPLVLVVMGITGTLVLGYPLLTSYYKQKRRQEL
jgi:hypothetical protein